MSNKPIPLLVLLLVSSLIACSPESKQYQIKGRISGPEKRTLQINGQKIKVSENGSFRFVTKIEGPVLLDISYANLEWPVFLNPESRLNIRIRGRSLDSIKYRGDLASCNTFLLGTQPVTEETNAYLNQNWVQIHQQNQEDYISTLDSLKGLYLEELEKNPKKYQSFSSAFIYTWKTEINFAFNKLILYYPQNHLSYTGESVALTDESIAYIKIPQIDSLDCIYLPSYNDYTKDWIDFQLGKMLEKEAPLKHYSLMEMDAISRLIPEIFTNQYLRDFWFSEYLKAHIKNNGIQNSHPFISLFEESCQTELLKKEMKRLVDLKTRSRNNHEVKTYKTAKGFKLDAHIFKPVMRPGESRPAIVIFHGGGWNGGNPSWAFSLARNFKNMGVIAISAQYRLCNTKDITITDAMADARDLISWLKLHAFSLGIEPGMLAAYGWSAGAHLISSAAIFSDSIPGSAINSIPEAMVLLSPAVSLPKGKGWEGWKQNVFGARTTVSSANPVEHVREGLPPTIILQGRDDTVTPLEGVQEFHDEMLAHGNHCELFIYDGVGHLFTPNTIPDNGEPKPDKEIQKKALDEIIAFLKELGYIRNWI